MLSLDLRPNEHERADMLSKRVLDLEQKLVQLTPLSGRGGWWRVVREPSIGAWQRNEEISYDTVLTYSAAFACQTLIASDMGKLTVRLVEKDQDGIWNETENSAYSPVLRRPNRYQTFSKYVEQYINSKLSSGNVYVLKERDGSRKVRALYVLDPSRVSPMVAPDGSVYYELKRDDLSGQPQESVTVPASEIIHDTMVALYHPLLGVSPLYACGAAATQGLAIQSNSTKLFTNGAIPGGILTAPGVINDETAQRLKAYWETEFSGDNVGRVAMLGDGLHYEPMAYKAIDMQLIEQLRMTGENVCTAYKVPAYMVGIGPPPPYANVGPLIQQYYSQCLQSLIKNFEDHHDAGLGLGPDFENDYGVELDINDLIWMDIETRTKAAAEGVTSGLSFNESRKMFFGLGRVKGGESPMAQQQNFSLAALAERDADHPFSKPTSAPAAATAATNSAVDMVKLASLVRRKQQTLEASRVA